jgi:ABC-type cobalamin/Fe3+-siderophores transport system ATPase subunit
LAPVPPPRHQSSHAPHHFRQTSLEDLRLRLQGPEQHQSRHQPRRILALLGPNGAGKTALISITCGIANLSEGSVTVDGRDINRDYRAARSPIGLVP